MTAKTGEEAWAIGIDVGGTKTAGGLVRFPEGEVTARQVIPTGAGRGPAAVLSDIADLASRLRERLPPGRALAGIGLGVPELVDLQGRVTSGQTIDWRGIDLTGRLAEFGLVRVEADVRAAALAEARFGAGRPYRTFAYVSVGTGISSTLVQDSLPYAGARGNALVLASGPVSTLCPHCHALGSTVLEDLASGPALVVRYNRTRPGAAARAEDVLAVARAGDAVACRVVAEAGEALGSGVAFLVNVLDPEAVVVGGGLGLAGGPYWEAFVRSARRHIWAGATRLLPIEPAERGAEAGLVGAAAAAWLSSSQAPPSA